MRNISSAPIYGRAGPARFVLLVCLAALSFGPAAAFTATRLLGPAAPDTNMVLRHDSMVKDSTSPVGELAEEKSPAAPNSSGPADDNSNLIAETRAIARPEGLRLRLTADFGQREVWEFIGPKALVIGRGEGAAVRLPDDEPHSFVSRHHAVIELGRAKAIVRDLGSLNGTYLNGHLVGQRPSGRSRRLGLAVAGAGSHLAHGDRLTLGPFNFEVAFHDERKSSGGYDQSYGSPNPECPGCGRPHQEIDWSRSQTPDRLCQDCVRNPAAALKLLKAGLDRKIPELAALKGLKVIRTLGRGSTSAVFLAQRKSNGEELAMKVLSPDLAENDWTRKSFLREIAICRRLNHPNVVKVFDFGYYAGAFFYLMEYCPGGTAEEARLNQGGRLPLETALAITMAALNGLSYLHGVKLAPSQVGDLAVPAADGLVHRDLKPANIFLGGPNGLTPKIADIGVGKAFSSAGMSGHTRTGSVAGSPATMPRQQVINFKYAGPEVDVWALMACLYKFITGHYPRDFPPDQDPWRVVLSQRPVPVLERRADIPANLAKLIDAALIDNPNLAYQDACGLKEALNKAILDDGFNVGEY